MESLETAELFIDNLLDFSSDIGEEDDEDADNNKKALFGGSKPNNHHQQPPQQLTELNVPDSELDHGSAPMLIEEELEWLSNRDAFPPIETFDILCETKPKNHSPVSVLGSTSLHVPVQARSKRRRRKRSNFSDLSGQQWWSWCETKKKSVEATGTSSASSFGRKCEHCQAEKTPQWRAGPLGPKTLCNACGVRYKSGRLFPEYRPANSPTFSNRLHSNSHRKILDMRRQKQKDMSFQPFDKGR